MEAYSNLLLIFLQLWSVNAGVSYKMKHGAEDAIVFPGPYKEPVGVRYGDGDGHDSPLVPPDCQHKTYCTIKPPNYPDEKFNQLFKNKKIAPLPSLVQTDVGDRYWDDEDNCKSTVSYEPIYILKTRSGEWRNVVQAPKQHYEQRVRMETCEKPEAPCFKAFPSVPDYTPFCKQKYNTWEILVENPDGGTETIKSELPVCCSCFYRPVDLRKS